MRRRSSSHLALYGIIGFPLGHTLSPAMQQAAFDRLRLPARYLPFEAPPRELARVLALLRGLRVRGFNVTVPYKGRVLQWLDGADGIARALGAVNTVVQRRGNFIGYNTDVAGLLAAWRTVPVRWRHATALLLGAGGAARAVLWALKQRGVRRVAVTNRTASRAQAIARWCRRTLPRLDVTVIPWRARARWAVIERPHLAINATSIGLRPRDGAPLATQQLSRRTVIYDLVYRAPTTTWVASARRRGLLAFDGRDMLLYQGARSFSLWTRRAAPLAVMRHALQQALRSQE